MGERSPGEWKALYESPAFAQENTYDGPLGPEYTPAATTLRLWSPAAQQVTVRLYRSGRGGVVSAEQALERQPRGLWAVTLPGDRAGQYYTFAVTIDGVTRETIDPYARTAGVNGLRGMILSPAQADPPGWQQDRRPAIPAHRRAIWEVNVRDFSADPASGIRMSRRGKYLGMAQDGTTLYWDGMTPTGLSYLKQLGVSHVQLMPIYDFGSVDEAHAGASRYNWGYDPANFNVPEGSYSSDPYRGEVRVRELKTMIAALHAAGIGVVMDVVYNHMYRQDNPLNSTAPYYFFRQNPDGTLSNGSGCGNETATERPMCRRYILDSLVYWATEYHLDGFRFDLMGLLDVDTMNAARAALDALPGGENILMYGEPWQGGASAMQGLPADKGNLDKLSGRIGVFCDDTRDAIKGSCFDARQPGYVSGRAESRWDVGAGVAAFCRSDRFAPQSPAQIITYVSAHDNFTLWDKLLQVRYPSPNYQLRDEAVLAQNRLAAGIYLTSMGTPFMQAGEEFARTKLGEGNSYNLPLGINRLEWGRVATYRDLVAYYRDLLALRAQFPRLGRGQLADAKAITFLTLPEPLVGWSLPAAPGDDTPWHALTVYYNPLESEQRVALPAGGWKLLSDGTNAGLWRAPGGDFLGSVSLKPVSATIFGQLRG